MVWTNVVGAAFSAALLSVSDSGATFVYADTGKTNRVNWSELSPATAARIQSEREFAPVPPALAATWARAQAELQRADDLLADGNMSPELHARRRAAVLRAFGKVCRAKGLPEETARRLDLRLRTDAADR